MKHLLLATLIITGISGMAQNACDSLEIVSVTYSPFSDTLIEVRVINHYQQTFFSYPGFLLLNAQGDTLAKETVNFFGIGSIQTHLMAVKPGMITSAEFEGTLELWTLFFDTLACTWTDTFRLCPDSCFEVYPTFANFGGALVTGSIGWSMLDSNNMVVGTGTFELNDTTQMDEDTLCLTPGHYTLMLDSTGPVGGQPYVSLRSPFYGSQLQWQFTGNSDEFPFVFFNACIDRSTSIAETPEGMDPNLLIFASDKRIMILSTKTPIGMVQVYDLRGRLVHASHESGQQATLSLRGQASGIYLVRVQGDGVAGVKKVWVE